MKTRRSSKCLAELRFDIGERVQVPRVKHQRLLADHPSTGPQAHSNVRIMQVIRRAHGQPVDSVPFTPQLLQLALETLGLGEELSLAVEAVEDSDRIVGVERGD